MTAFLIALGVWLLLWITFKLGKAKGRTEMVEEAFRAGWQAHQLSEELQEEDFGTSLHVEQQRQAGREGRQ